MDYSLGFVAIVFIVLAICIYNYVVNSDEFQLKCVVYGLDGN